MPRANLVENLRVEEGLFPAVVWGWDPRDVDGREVPPNVAYLTSLIAVDQALT